MARAAEDLLRMGIESSLSNFSDANAVFLAERLLAMSPSEAHATLLATAYMRARQPAQAVHALDPWCKAPVGEPGGRERGAAPQTRFTYATALVASARYVDAEVALRTGPDDPVVGGAHGVYLLATICHKMRRISEAIDLYLQALDLNPLLWVAFDALAALGHGDAALSRIPNDDAQVITTLRHEPTQTFKRDTASSPPPPTNQSTPAQATPMETANDDPAATASPHLTPRKRTVSPRVTPAPQFSLSGVAGPSPVPQSPPANDMVTPVDQVQSRSRSPPAAPPPNPNRRLPRVPAFLVTAPEQPGSGAQGHHGAPLRRSARLSLNAHAATAKDEGRGTNSIGSRSPPPQQKQGPTMEAVDALSNRLRRSGTTDCESAMKPRGGQDHTSAMQILYRIAQGAAALSSFRCSEALQILQGLPKEHANTGYVLSLIGRAYMELYDYPQAEEYFAHALQVDPMRLSGLVEYYSTALWQMRKEVALAELAQRVVQIDRHNPAVWCVVGNCFSLQKDQDMALKFFKRAVQLNKRMPYAYTLAGHEYAAKEDFESADAAYRAAISLDERHYNAWYGIANVLTKQEKHEAAERYYRNALRIHPRSSTLSYHLGMSLHAQGKDNEALQLLNRAVSLDGKNPVTKYERARVLSALGRYEESLSQLRVLNRELPREATVYFEMGQIYRMRGEKNLALRYFATALDLDPKERAYKKAVDSADDSRTPAEAPS